MSEVESSSDQVELLVEEFLEKRRNGTPTTILQYQKQYPQIAREIGDVFNAVLALEDARETPAVESPLDTFAAISSGKIRQLGDFRIIRKISQGGMGVIYEAIEKSLSRKVAIKVLASHLVSKPSAVERFHREAKTVARLHHTNIVSVLGAGFENDVHFFVMQFIEGESIDRLIQSEKFLSQYKNNWSWIAETMKRVALALRHAHQQNVLHRDIKPGNILIDQYGKPWVTDFGLAKLDDFEDLTRPGDAVGTLRYMAPEQMAGEPDVRSDIYGLGMVMYELLVSQKAFSGVQGRELLERISKGDLPPPQRLNSRIPLDLAKIVEKAIHPSPNDRYQQAVDLAEDLDRWQQDLPISARRLNPIQKTSRWARRNPVVAGLSFVVACLVISLGVAFSFVSMAWINESSVRQDLQVARKQAEDERRNVERNVEIAMQVLMELSEGLDRPGMVSQEIPSQVQLFSPYGGLPISSATENRLKAIQRFYVSLAETSSSDREIRIRSALANVRLAEILIQLGRFQEAVGHLSNVRKELQASTGFEFEKLLFHSVDVLADAHLNLQNYTEAERLFQDQLVRIGESSLDEKFKTMETGKAFLGLSRAAHWSGQVDLWNQNSRLAISSFEKVMADDPPSKSSVAAVFLARAYLSLPPRHSTDGHSEFTQQARLRAVDIFLPIVCRLYSLR